MTNKTPKIKSIFSIVFVGVLSMLLMAGCASSASRSIANSKISESEKAISVAKEINASTNIPVDLRNAENKLVQANSAFKTEEYAKAARLAEKATIDADYARIQANAEKSENDAEQMRQNLVELRRDLERISR
jgi:hypothetical protein